jgi:hypothetical protein
MTMSCDTARDLAPAFALGALEPAEERAVRDHLATCGQPHPEFEAFGGIVPYFDETVELVEPPASLKGRVLAAVAAEPRPRARRTARAGEAPSGGLATGTAAVPAVPIAAPAVPVVPLPGGEAREDRTRRRSGAATWLLRIAAVLAIAGLAGWNLLLQAQLGSATAYDRAVAAVLEVAARQGSQTAILSGDGGRGPRGIAAVGSDGSVVLAMRELDPTVGSQVYEAWLIAPHGGPVPLGGFQVGSDGTASFATRATAAKGVIIALTREPAPDATTPTLPIVSKGVATAPSS